VVEDRSETVHQLARRHNGAIEVGLPTGKPLMIFIAGPIKHWWGFADWDAPQVKRYFEWRDAVEVACVEAGFLVYMPHMAWRGSWHEDAQLVNNHAIETVDVVIDLTPPGIPADGTTREITHAYVVGKNVMALPPGDDQDLAAAMEVLTYVRDRDNRR